MEYINPVDGKIRLGSAYLWLDPVLNSLGLVDMTMLKEVSGIIPQGIYYPKLRSSATQYMGYTLGVRLNFEEEERKFKSVGSLSYTKKFVTEENWDVQGQLVFNNDWRVIAKLLPNGPQSTVDKSFGGDFTKREYALLVIMTDNLEESGFVPCIYYKKGTFKAISYQASMREQGNIDFVYDVGTKTDPITGCPIGVGGRSGRLFFIEKFTGALYPALATPGVTMVEDVIASDYYPLIVGGMM